MKPVNSICLALLVPALTVVLPSTAAARQTPPNIVVILADDLGYGDLGCYGAPDLRTPHIDRLVAGGLKFTEAYANCPVCSPTRAALLTGRYPDMVGVPGVIRTHPENSWGWLSPDAVLLPELLKRADYYSGIVGKWHLGLESPNTPIERGFDHFHGFLGDMMDDYYNHRRHGNNYMFLNRQEIDPPGHATDLFTQWSVDFLSTAPRDRPFFLYLAYNAPHTPIQPPADWLSKVRARHPELPERRARLVALIEHMDDGIGRVLDALKASGRERETVIVFTSDNGGQLDVGARNGALRDGKQSVYEGGLKVPMCVTWPARIQAGSQTSQRVLSMDIYATLAELAGLELTSGHDGTTLIPAATAAQHPSKLSQSGSATIDGVSFAPTLRGESQPELRQDWFFRRREGGARYGGKTIEAVRRGPWKLLQNSPFEPRELYNLEQDPLESTNVIDQYPQIARQLSAALSRQFQRHGSVPWQAPLQK